MTTRNSKASKVNDELSRALADEVKLIREKDETGAFKYELLDRMRVYDRAIKIEAIRLKLTEEDYGSKFRERGDER